MIGQLFLSWVFFSMASSLLLYGMATRSLRRSYQTISSNNAHGREKEGNK